MPLSDKIRTFLLLACLTLAHGCGGLGESDTSGCDICGPREDIYGSISSQAGGQAAMAGWVVVLIEKNSKIARVGEVDAAGLYTLRQVKTDASHTIVLLSPDYIVQAVLSLPGSAPNTIKQFFKLKSTNLPKLIYQGPIVKFQDTGGIAITRDLAADDDGDGVPNGSQSIGAALLQAARDTDVDGTVNENDPDIDGDGVINIIDPDDDGDAVFDVIDGDADDNLKNDVDYQVGDQFFGEGVEYIAVQWQKKPKLDGSGSETSILFSTKLRSLNEAPKSVQIRGAPTILNAAQVATVDENGEPALATWNRLLEDNGLTSDDAPGDNIFAATVKLADGQAPRAHEMVFFQLRFGAEDNPWFLEFPYTFPPLVPGDIVAQYESNSQSVLLSGEAGKKAPFGDLQDYRWTVVIKNADGVTVHNSPQNLGSERSYAIPANILLSGQTYTFNVVAQVLPKVAGIPSYSIQSPDYTIAVP